MKRYKPYFNEFNERVTKTKSGKYKGVYKDKPRYFDTKEEANQYEKTGSSKIENDIKDLAVHFRSNLAGRNISKDHKDFKDFKDKGRELLKKHKDSGGTEEEFNKLFKGHKDEKEMSKNRDNFKKEIDNHIEKLKKKGDNLSNDDIKKALSDITELGQRYAHNGGNQAEFLKYAQDKINKATKETEK